MSGLFQRDVMDDLLRELVPAMESQFPDEPTSMDKLFEFFETRILDNLHIVLCFSPVSKRLLRKMFLNRFSWFLCYFVFTYDVINYCRAPYFNEYNY